jgi:hypothetical protein
MRVQYVQYYCMVRVQDVQHNILVRHMYCITRSILQRPQLLLYLLYSSSANVLVLYVDQHVKYGTNKTHAE